MPINCGSSGCGSGLTGVLSSELESGLRNRRRLRNDGVVCVAAGRLVGVQLRIGAEGLSVLDALVGRSGRCLAGR